jgi:biopolymer transport protein ExbD
MRNRMRHKKVPGSYDVNLTPLIDVSLVLVVMLLLLTPLAFESSIAVRKAASSAKKSESPEKEERVEINIVSEDSVVVNRTIVSRTALYEVLSALLMDKAQRRVVIDCSDHVSHGTFVAVLDDAKLCGAAEIAVLGR